MFDAYSHMHKPTAKKHTFRKQTKAMYRCVKGPVKRNIRRKPRPNDLPMMHCLVWSCWFCSLSLSLSRVYFFDYLSSLKQEKDWIHIFSDPMQTTSTDVTMSQVAPKARQYGHQMMAAAWCCGLGYAVDVGLLWLYLEHPGSMIRLAIFWLDRYIYIQYYRSWHSNLHAVTIQPARMVDHDVYYKSNALELCSSWWILRAPSRCCLHIWPGNSGKRNGS